MALGIRGHLFMKALRNGVKRLGFLISALKSPMMNILADSNETPMAWILP